MSPEAFTHWIETVKKQGLASTDRDCGRLLGISANSIVTLKKQGADLRTALACNALLHGIAPFDAPKPKRARPKKADGDNLPPPKFRPILDDEDAA